jgi:ribosomal protein S18 acetylase RimI-like enzyme
MSQIPLEPVAIGLDDPVLAAISAWPFEQEFFHRVLTEDIPQRVQFESAKVWAYRDPSNTIVGFGSLSVCSDYRDFSNGKKHAYIPLLGVHPDMQGVGHGKAIVGHLVEQAANLIGNNAPDEICDFLFLDVYEDSGPAIGLYKKHGFAALGNCTFIDPKNNKNFHIMAKRVAR